MYAAATSARWSSSSPAGGVTVCSAVLTVSRRVWTIDERCASFSIIRLNITSCGPRCPYSAFFMRLWITGPV
jgi:hypothetical protein